MEAANVNYFLGESVMEPDQRIEVNQKGFCARHFRQLYDAGNRLGLGLMTHTHLKETLRALGEHAKRMKAAAEEEAGKPVYKRIGPKKGAGVTETAGELANVSGRCVLCERLSDNMERYIYTLLYMYKHEAEFPALFAKSKGMCLKHYREALAMAPKHLTGDRLKQFVDTLVDLEIENFARPGEGNRVVHAQVRLPQRGQAVGQQPRRRQALHQQVARANHRMNLANSGKCAYNGCAGRRRAR